MALALEIIHKINCYNKIKNIYCLALVFYLLILFLICIDSSFISHNLKTTTNIGIFGIEEVIPKNVSKTIKKNDDKNYFNRFIY